MGPKKLIDWAVFPDHNNIKVLVGVCDGEWIRLSSLKSVNGRMVESDTGELYSLDGPPYKQDNFDSILKDMVK